MPRLSKPNVGHLRGDIAVPDGGFAVVGLRVGQTAHKIWRAAGRYADPARVPTISVGTTIAKGRSTERNFLCDLGLTTLWALRVGG